MGALLALPCFLFIVFIIVALGVLVGAIFLSIMFGRWMIRSSVEQAIRTTQQNPPTVRVARPSELPIAQRAPTDSRHG